VNGAVVTMRAQGRRGRHARLRHHGPDRDNVLLVLALLAYVAVFAVIGVLLLRDGG
jgi:hypothetical protein